MVPIREFGQRVEDIPQCRTPELRGERFDQRERRGGNQRSRGDRRRNGTFFATVTHGLLLCSMAMLIFSERNSQRQTKHKFRRQKVPKVHDPQTSETFQTPFFSVVTYESKIQPNPPFHDMFVSCDSTGDRREPVYTSFEKKTRRQPPQGPRSQTSETFQTPFFSVVTYEQKMDDNISEYDMFVTTAHVKVDDQMV